MKNFIRGMGVGILITTLVFAIAYMVRGNQISDEEVRQRAKQLGMVEETPVIVKPQETPSNPASTGQAVNGGADAPQEVTTEGTGLLNMENDSGEGTGTELQDIQSQESNLIVPENLSPGAVVVQIGKGQDGITISQLLQSHGVIEDAADFNRYLSDNRLQMNILWGDFILEKNMPYEAIVDKIIAK